MSKKTVSTPVMLLVVYKYNFLITNHWIIEIFNVCLEQNMGIPQEIADFKNPEEPESGLELD